MGPFLPSAPPVPLERRRGVEGIHRILGKAVGRQPERPKSRRRRQDGSGDVQSGVQLAVHPPVARRTDERRAHAASVFSDGTTSRAGLRSVSRVDEMDRDAPVLRLVEDHPVEGSTGPRGKTTSEPSAGGRVPHPPKTPQSKPPSEASFQGLGKILESDGRPTLVGDFHEVVGEGVEALLDTVVFTTADGPHQTSGDASVVGLSELDPVPPEGGARLDPTDLGELDAEESRAELPGPGGEQLDPI